MDFADDEKVFLRDVIKAARQKTHHVKWVDRDGTERLSTFNQTEIVRVNTIAGRLRISKTELLRQAAHIPVAKSGPAEAAEPTAS